MFWPKGWYGASRTGRGLSRVVKDRVGNFLEASTEL